MSGTGTRTGTGSGKGAASSTRCWCGEARLDAFSDSYRRCSRCGTLILARFPRAGHFRVADDETDFYGRTYWTEHVARAYGQPTIFERARLDLPERCVFWLQRVLEHAPPGGRLLELGCGHGGFVYLTRLAGFDSVGLEMSPWVAEFAKRAFGVQVLRGPLEDLDLPAASFKVVAAFDVLEHLEDPLRTLRLCHRLLGPDGVLFLQTPCYRGEGPAWEQFKDQEHTFLFTEDAIHDILRQAGFSHLAVRESLFPYDMWIAAGKASLAGLAPASTDGLPPVVQALVDAGLRCLRLEAELADVGDQAGQRLDAAERLRAELEEVERDRAERLRGLEDLSARLEEVERDRAERLRGLEDLGARLEEVERDRALRLENIHTLTDRLEEVERDRAERLERIRALTVRLEEVERDRALRLEKIHELTSRLTELEQDPARRLEQPSGS
jgi:SAM-dependent methyltransferase